MPPSSDASRLDLFLVAELPSLSRRRIRRWIESRLVTVNGRRAAAGSLVRPGDVVFAEAEPPQGAERLLAEPQLRVVVLHQDADLVAIDKPPGMPSLARRSDDRGTLSNFLIARYPELRGLGPRLECGIVHRLDPGTSGLLLVARNAVTYDNLRSQFRNHSVAKDYLAVVAGDLIRAGSIENPIAHVPRRRRRMIACQDAVRARELRARAAVTHYHPLRGYGSATLVKISMSTGVRHQIRVHLASIGHPILGDTLYGDSETGSRAERLMLHASGVRFDHPASGRMELSAPVPSPFESSPELPRS